MAEEEQDRMAEEEQDRMAEEEEDRMAEEPAASWVDNSLNNSVPKKTKKVSFLRSYPAQKIQEDQEKTWRGLEMQAEYSPSGKRQNPTLLDLGSC